MPTWEICLLCGPTKSLGSGGQCDFAALAAKVQHDVEQGSHSELGSIVDRAICTAAIQGGRTSNEKTGSAVGASRALQPTEPNPLDFVPDKIPFDTPYGPAISLDRAEVVIHAAVAEAKKRNWKMNVAVVDSGGNLVAFQRMDGAMLASIQIAEHKTRAAAAFRRETKQFEGGIQLMHLNYLLAFDGILRADQAEAYGYINRALPDAELDAFVEALATRIAGFDKWAFANTKRLVNTSLPPDVELDAGWDACIASLGRPAAQNGIKALMARGFHKPGDVENRLGYYLGQVAR